MSFGARLAGGLVCIRANLCFVSPDITQDKTRKMTKTVEKIKKLMGLPRNYGKCEGQPVPLLSFFALGCRGLCLGLGLPINKKDEEKEKRAFYLL